MENYQGIPNDNTSKPLDHDNFDVESIYNFDELDIDISESLNDYVEELPMSDNPEINKFIREDGELEWIPYEQLTNIEYLAHGGFGVVSKAKWDSLDVALKSLNNSKELTADILQEITYHQLFDHCRFIIYVAQCFGISQDPATKNYLMVMHYFEGGSLRQYLDNNYNELSFNDKLGLLYSMTNGLFHIHLKGLIHKDFHPGNILNKYNEEMQNVGCFVTDFGLCKPIDEAGDNKQIYGVLPYIAPEVLRGEPYTQESDIYSLGIVAYELFSGLPPYFDVPHDISLTISICNGLRPNLDIISVPQLLKELIIKCWDINPLQRPNAENLLDNIRDWYFKRDQEFNQQVKVAEELLTKLETSSNLTYQTHQQAIYVSRLLELNISENL